MRSFRAVICALLLTAVTIIALPTGNNPRSLSSGSSVDTLVVRNIEVKFGKNVPEHEHEAIKAQVIAHHNSLPDNHPRKAAAYAHVFKGYHLTPGEEHKGDHASFRYYKAGAVGGKNVIGDGIHLDKPKA